MSRDVRDPQDRFDQALVALARKAPDTAPADAAAQVLSRLPRRRAAAVRRTHPMWAWANVATAVALAMVVGLRFAPTPPPQADPPGAAEVQPLPEAVVLMWLDAETPLYLTVQPPAGAGGSNI
ncbi:MAG: hypothetical protein AAGM22_24815 [Acidobacteriota bacterium]